MKIKGLPVHQVSDPSPVSVNKLSIDVKCYEGKEPDTG